MIVSPNVHRIIGCLSFIQTQELLEQQIATLGAFLNTINCRNKLRGYSVVVLCSFAQQERVQHDIKMICPFIESAFYYEQDKKDRGICNLNRLYLPDYPVTHKEGCACC